MDAIGYIQGQMGIMRRLLDGVTQDTTDEQFNWTPPGVANTIKASLVHLLVSEDYFIQDRAQGKPTVWETGGWGEKIGLTRPPGRGRGWDEIKEKTLAIAPVLEYRDAVRAATDAYLATATPEELDRKVEFLFGQQPIAEVLAILVVHEMGHMGKIAAMKGVQGVKGLPF